MIEFILPTIALAFFISSFTLGLRLVSDDGMLLFPLRRFCLSFGLKKQLKIFKLKKRIELLIAIENHKAEKGLNFVLYQMEVERLAIRSERLDWISFKIEAWHKPFLTCSTCMPSFWGIVICSYFYFVLGVSGIWIVAPFSILFSVLINVLISQLT